MKIPAPWTAFTTTDNQSWSFARVTSGALVASCIFWVTFLVIVSRRIPDNLPGLATLILSIYGINRGAEAWENKSESKTEQTESHHQ